MSVCRKKKEYKRKQALKGGGVKEVKDDDDPGQSETEAYSDNEIVTDLEAPTAVEEISTMHDQMLPDFLYLGMQQ